MTYFIMLIFKAQNNEISRKWEETIPVIRKESGRKFHKNITQKHDTGPQNIRPLGQLIHFKTSIVCVRFAIFIFRIEQFN